MVGKQININPKEKTVDIFVDDITVDEIKEHLKRFKNMSDYEFRIHNPQQTTDLISVYEYDVIDEFPPSIASWVYGTDFGFNDPHATVRVALHENVLYVDEIIYESGLTLDDVDKRFSSRIADYKYTPNYCDSSRPEMIDGLHRRGWNVHACIKGKGSVQDQIAWMKSYPIRITRRSSNILREIEGYKWITDRAGKILEEPVDYDNHAMDAIRYAGYTHYAKPTVAPDYKTISKREVKFETKGAW